MSGELLLVEAAQATVLAGVEPLADVERIAPEAALGRVLAAPLVAGVSLPPWDNSAMDGYAVRAADVAAAAEGKPVRLTVVGESRAGSAPDARVMPETAIRIATGAPMPAGADAVVRSRSPRRSIVGQRRSARPGRRTAARGVPRPRGGRGRQRGADARERRRGRRDGRGLGVTVTPAVVALASGAGLADIVVRRRPIVACSRPATRCGPPARTSGRRASRRQRPGIRSLVREAGAVPLELGIAADRLGDVEARLRRGIAEADIVVVSGGVSVGPYDVVRLAFDAVGHINLWRVAVQPGKPFAFGRADVEGRPDPVLLFGLPGNPVSSFVTFELFVRPVIRRLAGQPRLHRPVDRAVLEDAVTKSPGRRGYQRVAALRDAEGLPQRDDRGRVRVRLAGGQGSHVLSALAAADALAVIPEPLERAEAGTEVELRWLDQG